MNQGLVGVLSTLATLGAIGVMAQPDDRPRPEPRPAAATAPPMTPAQSEALRQAFNLPAGTEVEVELTTRDAGSVRTKQEGRGIGAGAVAEGDKLDQKFDGTPPRVGLGADGSLSGEGGGADANQKGSALKLPPLPWQNPLFWIGLACLGVCGFGVYSQLRRLALISGVAGVGLIAAAFYPVILLFAVAAVLVVILGPYVFTEFKKRQAEKQAKGNNEALRAVTAGVEHPMLPNDMKATITGMLPAGTTIQNMDLLVQRLMRNVKAAIAKEADGQDKELIDKVKQADKIGKYAD